MLSRCQLSHLSKRASTSVSATRSSPWPANQNYNSSSYHHSSVSRTRQSTRAEPSPQYPRYLQDIDESPIPSRQRSRNKSVVPSESSAPRQTMTERESKVLTDMLDMIFASNEEPGSSSAPEDALPTEHQGGVGPVQVDDLFRRLRRLNTRKPTNKARAATVEMFDLKKEEMNKCQSDQELLAWAQREVFEESEKYEKAAKQIADEAVKDGKIQKNAPPLQSPIYPLMIAHLMRTFRDHYHDPNLALYIFKYAQKLSIVSYAFGCSTDSYNELIETRWSCFRDLRGVLDAIKEMKVNAVPANSQTHALVDRIRRDFGTDDTIRQSQHSTFLAMIEDTLSMMAGVKAAHRITLGAWKNTVAEDDKGGFDDWSNTALLNFNPKTRRPHYR